MDTIAKISNATVLVTGASGLSGSIIIKELVKQNIPVRTLVRDRSKAKELEQFPKVEIYEADMLQPQSLFGAFEGIEKALMISSTDDKMIETQQSFIDTAKKAGLPHLIKYSGHDTGIGFSGQNFIAQVQHASMEDYLVDSGLNWTILRIAQFMQFYLPGTVTGVSLERNALILPIENGKLAPVDIEDVAKICAGILTGAGHEERIYEISGPDVMNMKEACEIISRVTGKQIDYINISLQEYKEGLVSMNVPEFFVRVLTELSKERKKCVDSHVWLDTHRLLGVRPTNFAEFIYKNREAFDC